MSWGQYFWSYYSGGCEQPIKFLTEKDGLQEGREQYFIRALGTAFLELLVVGVSNL